MRRAAPGQALVLAAFMLSVLAALAFGTLTVVTHRRVLSRAQLAVDEAALRATAQMNTARLVTGQPGLDVATSRAAFRAALTTGLAAVAPALATSVADVVSRAEIVVVNGGTCTLISAPVRTWTVSGPTVCARIWLPVGSPLGDRTSWVDTTTQGTEQADTAASE